MEGSALRLGRCWLRSDVEPADATGPCAFPGAKFYAINILPEFKKIKKEVKIERKLRAECTPRVPFFLVDFPGRSAHRTKNNPYINVALGTQ